MCLQLTLSTLGDLVIRLDGQAVTDFPTRKAEALLVYPARQNASKALGSSRPKRQQPGQSTAATNTFFLHGLRF